MLKISGVCGRIIEGAMVFLLCFLIFGTHTEAAGSKEFLNELNAGVANLLDASGYNSESNREAIEELNQIAQSQEEARPEPEEAPSDLFMADVHVAMNVREEPTEDSSKVGLLYKDCGGRILEQVDGWTRIQSGDLVGWASNDYLAFGEEAEQMAADVGFPIVTVTTDALRVRKEPGQDSGVWGLLTAGDELEVVDTELLAEGWITVDYEGENGYVSADYVVQGFHIDSGETLEQIKIREEEERQAKLHAKQEALYATDDEVRLLGALIQCETGSVSWDGMLAVGAVVMNRVRSGAYPNTIKGVIFASGQFPPALNGKVADRYSNGVADSCLKAAQAAINGETNVGTATHFRRAGNHDGLLIAGQVFW